MGLLSEIIVNGVEQAIDSAVTTSIRVAAEAVEGTVKSTISTAGKMYNKIEPSLKISTESVKNTITSVAEQQRVLIEEKAIRNAFKGKKNGTKYLINCTNKKDANNLFMYEVFNNSMELICSVVAIKKSFVVTITIYDNDGQKMIEVSRKGLKNDVLYINDLLVIADSTIESKIKTFKTSTNIITGTSTYTLNDKPVGYSYKRKEYVGGQRLLDVTAVEYLIPLLIQEIERETKA